MVEVSHLSRDEFLYQLPVALEKNGMAFEVPLHVEVVAGRVLLKRGE